MPDSLVDAWVCRTLAHPASMTVAVGRCLFGRSAWEQSHAQCTICRNLRAKCKPIVQQGQQHMHSVPSSHILKRLYHTLGSWTRTFAAVPANIYRGLHLQLERYKLLEVFCSYPDLGLTCGTNSRVCAAQLARNSLNAPCTYTDAHMSTVTASRIPPNHWILSSHALTTAR